jgi:SHS2 domain-containing protein
VPDPPPPDNRGVYEWVDHTAELELRVEAPSPEAVFEEALTALGELLAERVDDRGDEPVRHEVTASAPDRATLLAEWLSELVYLVETEGFVPQRVERLDLREGELDATVHGRRARPPHLVKAVTYHRLEMREQDRSWLATVVLDV